MNYQYPHFIDEELWVQKVYVTYPMTLGQSLGEIVCQLIRLVIIHENESFNFYVTSIYIPLPLRNKYLKKFYMSFPIFVFPGPKLLASLFILQISYLNYYNPLSDERRKIRLMQSFLSMCTIPFHFT